MRPTATRGNRHFTAEFDQTDVMCQRFHDGHRGVVGTETHDTFLAERGADHYIERYEVREYDGVDIARTHCLLHPAPPSCK